MASSDHRGRVFPSYDYPSAEVSFREWMGRLTGLDADALEEWLMYQSALVLDEVQAARGINMRNQVSIARKNQHQVGWRAAEIVMVLAQGYTQREAAQILHIATDTVKGYLSEAYLGTGCRGVTQLLMYLIATGQIPPSTDDPSGAR